MAFQVEATKEEQHYGHNPSLSGLWKISGSRRAARALPGVFDEIRF
jgi:hypothetical protein